MEGDIPNVFKVKSYFCVPSNSVTPAYLSKSTKSLAYGVALTLFRGHKYHVAHKLRSRPDYGHVALEDVEEFREFVEARAAEELAVGVQANIVWEQVAVGVLLVGHGAELDELEDFFVEARAGLREEGVTLHLDCAEDSKHDEDRTQADDGCQSTTEIKGAFYVFCVHTIQPPFAYTRGDSRSSRE